MAIDPEEVADPVHLAAFDALAVFGTLAEQSFDDVVRLATRLFAAPVALVSLDAIDRQWFKAVVCLPARVTNLDRSVCKFALAKTDLRVIPDLSVDPRTAANLLALQQARELWQANQTLADVLAEILAHILPLTLRSVIREHANNH